MNELFGLAPSAWVDARAILARRWWLIVALGIVAAIALASPQPRTGDPLALGMMALALVGVAFYSFYIYADTMRLADPTFVVTPKRFWRIVLINFGVALILLVLWIPALVAMRVNMGLGQLLGLSANAFVAARFAFVNFAAENPEGAFFYSWRVTSGAALIPSLVLGTMWVSTGWILQRLADMTFGSGPVVHSVAVGMAAALTYGSFAFLNPWMFRWMRVAEAMQPVVEETTPG